nr:glycosyltransferase family 39 protein [Bordetella petrii]
MGVRLFAMATLPLIDTSEPRYAEIARIMAVSGDWVTPWFEPGEPFWGKPPLAFWAQALSIKLLGLSEFAVRLPSLLVMLLVARLVYVAARRVFGLQQARWAVLMLAAMLLPFVSAGAVLTDPFLTLGVTLSMLALMVAPFCPTAFWRYGFFIGLSIGLLAKGPLALVLIGGASLAWALWAREGRKALKALPWSVGLALMLAISLPWYVIAELKTPGFLKYFLVGEHFLRFVDAGWAGDRYGTAHARAWGAIWLDWIAASAPWSLLLVTGLLVLPLKSSLRQAAQAALREPIVKLLVSWALVAPVLFTFSGNILWTYVLPSLPPLALGLGCWLSSVELTRNQRLANSFVFAASLLVPIAAVVIGTLGILDEPRFKTEKGLVAMVEKLQQPGDTLYFVGSRPFSARYYSQGKAKLLPWQASTLPPFSPSGRLWVAVSRDKSWPLLASPGVVAKSRYSSRRFVLYELRKTASR